MNKYYAIDPGVSPSLAPGESADEAINRVGYQISGGAAHIWIRGVLSPDRLAYIYGYSTTYADIIAALGQAEGDDAATEIVLHIDSPGGSWHALDETMGRITQTTKPTTAIIHNMATSGAYGLASQADRVIATSRGALIGAIGIVATIYDTSEAEKAWGVERHIIVNTGSQAKRRDVGTAEGRSVVQEEVDDIYGVLESRIVDARNIDKSVIRALNDRTIMARRAKKIGLIDKIEGSKEGSFMTKSELAMLKEVLSREQEGKQAKAEGPTKAEASVEAETSVKAKEPTNPEPANSEPANSGAESPKQAGPEQSDKQPDKQPDDQGVAALEERTAAIRAETAALGAAKKLGRIEALELLAQGGVALPARMVEAVCNGAPIPPGDKANKDAIANISTAKEPGETDASHIALEALVSSVIAKNNRRSK